MSERINELEIKIDCQEQRSRQNSILIHMIARDNEENTNQQKTVFINDNLDIKIDNIDLDKSLTNLDKMFR